MGIKTKLARLGVETALGYLERNPEENIGRLLDFLGVLSSSSDETQRRKVALARRYLAEPGSPWRALVTRLYTDVDAEVRKTIFKNFLLGAYFSWSEEKAAYERRHHVNVPWTILMDPTSACNLRCRGCWAAEYGSRSSMDYALLDSIIAQGKEMGMRFFIYSGGEPLVRKDDIIRLCEAHPDCMFMAFTNGTLIDEAFAAEMLRVRNFIPAISVEGFEAETDSRRGKGTFAKVSRAMDVLRTNGLPFGVSCCYTSENVETIGSEEYYDWMIAKGAYFAWLFTFMPVGCGSPTSLMVSADQRAWMYDRVRAFRKTKPLFTLDFWNDGEFVDGCIAGGRRYLHINANGDVEPCAFIHYSDCNIRDVSLLEALERPLFMAYKAGQPFNSNHLRPCPLLDNPDCLKAIVQSTGARSTDMKSPEDVGDLTDKCRQRAAAWAPVADEIWARGNNYKRS